MRRCRLLWLVAFLLVFPNEAGSNAGYLVVSRDATLKSEARSDATVLQHFERGHALELLEEEQTSGYYHARDAASGDQGFIYRTLVRRYDEPPEDPQPAPSPGGTTTPSSPGSSGGAVFSPQAPTPDFFRDSDTHFYVHFISVDQGASALLEFPCGAILIDAGFYRSAYKTGLLDYLGEFFDGRPDLDSTFDAVIITHNHSDHTGALREVCNLFKVRNYIDNRVNEDDQQEIRQDFAARHTGTAIRGIEWSDVAATGGQEGLTDQVIDPVDCPGFDPLVRILAGSFSSQPPGWTATKFGNPNNHSLVIRVDYGESSVLFTGDLEEVAIEHLVDYYSGSPALNVDVYQAGHHGSANGTTEGLATAISPDIVVFSSGDPEYERRGKSAYGYGHPDVATVGLFDRTLSGRRSPSVTRIAFDGGANPQTVTINKPMFGTGWDGDVVVKLGLDGSMTVATSGHSGPS